MLLVRVPTWLLFLAALGLASRGFPARAAEATAPAIGAETRKWATSGDAHLVLTQALARINPQGVPDRSDLQLFITCTRGTWGPKLTTAAPNYNVGDHVATLVAADGRDPARVKLEFQLQISEDRWVGAADAAYTVELVRDGETLRGTYRGTCNGETVEGTLTGRFNGYTRRAETRPPLPRGARGYVFTKDGTYLAGATAVAGDAVSVTPEGRAASVVPMDNVLRAVLGDRDSGGERWEPPDPWRARDENTPVACAEAWSAGTMRLVSHGGGVREGAPESYQFVYQRTPGDCLVSLRVLSLESPPGASVGIMMRSRPDAGARFAYFEVLPRGGLRLTVRYNDHGPIRTIPLELAGGDRTTPVELRLPMYLHMERRAKGGLALFVSRRGTDLVPLTRLDRGSFGDGERWSLGAPTYVGVACIAGEGAAGTPARAMVDHFSIQRDLTWPPAPMPGGAVAGASPPPEVQLRGAGLVDGTFIAGAAASEVSESFTLEGLAPWFGKTLTLPASQLARLNFTDCSELLLQKVRPGTRGVLLRSGDFTEGQFRALHERQAQISSVIFGRQNFALADLRSVVARVPPAPAKKFVVRLVDGSLVPTDTVKREGDAMVFDPTAHPPRVPAGEVLSIARPGNVSLADAPLAAAATQWSEPLPVPAFDPGRGGTWDSGGAAAERAVVISSLAAATFDLGGRYASLGLRAGLRDLAPSDSRASLTVEADGKTVKTFDALLPDEPQGAWLDVRGVQKLIFRAAPVDGHWSPAVVLSDPLLVR